MKLTRREKHVLIISIIIIALHAPTHFASQILFFPTTAILFIFLFKPKPLKANRQQLTANRQ